MSNQIQVGMRKDFQSKDLWEMHRLRTRVFKDRMGWEVPILSGMEIDGYDAIDPYYMVIRGAGNVVCGCWRMLPTEGPYMLKDTFPELLHGAPVPEAANIWELSRFAIETEGPQGFGFAGLALDAMREIVRFGDTMGITNYVRRIEKYAHELGWVTINSDRWRPVGGLRSFARSIVNSRGQQHERASEPG